MGIYDRDYSREERTGLWIGSDWSAVTWILVITVGAYILQILFSSQRDDGSLTDMLALWSNLFTAKLLTHPWRIVELVTYGFAHAPQNILHVAFNMFFFWMFGRDIEARYGARKFVGIYLTAIIIAGLGWMLVQNFIGFPPDDPPSLIGASGGVSTILMLFVWLFPARKILFWGVLPMPMWVFALIWLVGDIRGAMQVSGKVAYSAHLTGAAYGFLVYRTGWSLLNWMPQRLFVKRAAGPKLRVHEPDDVEQSMSDQVDEILKKIQDHGQESLTARERKILEQASRRYQQKHR